MKTDVLYFGVINEYKRGYRPLFLNLTGWEIY